GDLAKGPGPAAVEDAERPDAAAAVVAEGVLVELGPGESEDQAAEGEGQGADAGGEVGLGRDLHDAGRGRDAVTQRERRGDDLPDPGEGGQALEFAGHGQLG